jgi:hypothetical protein
LLNIATVQRVEVNFSPANRRLFRSASVGVSPTYRFLLFQSNLPGRNPPTTQMHSRFAPTIRSVNALHTAATMPSPLRQDHVCSVCYKETVL